MRPLPVAAAPTLVFELSIDAGGRALRALGLNVRVQIRAERRRYGDGEAERMRELFGAVEDWGRSLGRVPWTQTAVHVGQFTGATTVGLHVPCTYDFEVAQAKYLAALDGGVVPLELLFSGTMSWDAGGGRVLTAMIPWDRDAAYAMPLDVWRRTMRGSFGDSAWVRVDRAVFARLQAYRSRRGLTTWDDTLSALLQGREA